jgi:hypothetical protein
LNQALRVARQQNQDLNKDYLLLGGGFAERLYFRRSLSKKGSAQSDAKPSIRIGSFNVQLNNAEFRPFLEKWRIDFDGNNNVLLTSRGAIFADIVGQHDIFAILEK